MLVLCVRTTQGVESPAISDAIYLYLHGRDRCVTGRQRCACKIHVCVEKPSSVLGEKARRLGGHPEVASTSSPYPGERSQLRRLGTTGEPPVQGSWGVRRSATGLTAEAFSFEIEVGCFSQS